MDPLTKNPNVSLDGSRTESATTRRSSRSAIITVLLMGAFLPPLDFYIVNLRSRRYGTDSRRQEASYS